MRAPQFEANAGSEKASQTDKKDEFRKYLERKKVVEVLTKTLTDLFELETRPDDALSYLHSKIGEHVKKPAPPAPAPVKTDAVADAPAPTVIKPAQNDSAMDVVAKE